MTPKVTLSAALILASVIVPSMSVPGRCPPVQTVNIPDLTSVMGLWWRPFRSQMAPDEPTFKCLSTEWTNLRGKKFDVVDNNVELVSGEKSRLTGVIEAIDAKNADWNIELSNGMRVNAQILDVDSEYMLMYSCAGKKETNTHEERGIIFTRVQNPDVNRMNEFIRRSEAVFRRNNLNHITMLPIPLNDC